MSFGTPFTLLTDHITTATVNVAANAVGALPAENVLLHDLHLLSRATGTNIEWHVDFGAPVRLFGLGIVGANYTADAEVSIDLFTGGIENTFVHSDVGPAWQNAAIYNRAVQHVHVKMYETGLGQGVEGPGIICDSARIIIDDPTNADGFMQAAHLFLPGGQWQPGITRDYPFSFTPVEENASERTPGGVKFFRQGPRYRQSEITFSNLEDVDVTPLYFRNIEFGQADRMIMLPRPDIADNSDRDNYYGHLSELGRFTKLDRGRPNHGYRLQFDELL